MTITEKCPCCKREINYSLIPVSADPYADFVCYDCLPEDMQKAYDKFFGHDQQPTTPPFDISVETHYDGQMKEAISKPWKVRTWKSDGSITFYKQLDDLKLYPRIWIVDVNNEIPPSIKQALLNALTEPLYSIKTWDPELQKYTPQIDVPSENLTRAQLVASMRMLQEIGYSCHRIRERDDDGNHTGYADSDAYVMIERIN